VAVPSKDSEVRRKIREAADKIGGKSADVLRKEDAERARARLAYIGGLAEEQVRTQERLRGERYKG
jgi:hypothetical protein